jgi:hypothetical protein
MPRPFLSKGNLSADMARVAEKAIQDMTAKAIAELKRRMQASIDAGIQEATDAAWQRARDLQAHLKEIAAAEAAKHPKVIPIHFAPPRIPIHFAPPADQEHGTAVVQTPDGDLALVSY